MDVKCERCGTVYELDETLVLSRGTTVKCTQCGHVFRVLPRGVATSSSGWKVRKEDGSELAVASLKELQRQIAQGRLAEGDEISREGSTWKALGQIAELRSFFEVSRASPPAGSRRVHQHTRLGIGSVSPEEPAPSGPTASSAPTVPGEPLAPRPPSPPQTPAQPPRPAPPVRKPTLMGMGLGAGSTAETVAASPRQEPPSARTPATRPTTSDAPTSAPPAGAWVEGPGIEAPPEMNEGEAFADTMRAIEPPAGTSTGRRSVPTVASTPRQPRRSPLPAGQAAPHSGREPRHVLYLDEEDDFRPPVRRSPWVAILLFLLVPAIGVGVWLGWPQISARLGIGQPADKGAPFLARADAELAKDDIAGYQAAVDELLRATAVDAHDARVLTDLSRAHALWAQALQFDAADLAARAEHDPSLAGKASALRDEAKQHVSDAKRYGEQATSSAAPGTEALGDAELAYADALRLSGDLRGAGEQIADARKHFDREPAEMHRVAALLAVARAHGDVGRARDEARKAVDTDGGLVRTRLLLARALLAQHDVAAARSQVQAVLSAHPGQPRASALERAIEQGIAPAFPVVAVLDGGTANAAPKAEANAADAGVAPVAAETPAAGAAAGPQASTAGNAPAPATKNPRVAPAEVPAGHDYNWYVSRGRELIENGDVGRAKRYFETALNLRPAGPEALSGLGYVALNGGDAAGAVRRFEPAARSGFADAYIGLGAAYRELGRVKDALQAYKAYLQRAPGGGQSTIARNWINQLQGQVKDTSQQPEAPPSSPPAAPTSPSPPSSPPPSSPAPSSSPPSSAPPSSPAPSPAPPPPPANGSGTQSAPATPPSMLPAPKGTTPSNPPPTSDTKAIGSE